MDGIIFERNLLSLTKKSSSEAVLLTQCSQSEKINFRVSKTGLPVPCQSSDKTNTRFQALHSLVDPEREGKRLAGRVPNSGYIICLGLGGGYHLMPLLQRSGISRILIIEDDPSLVRSFLEQCDLSPLFVDPRVSLLCGKSLSELKRFLISDYIPLIGGNLATYPLNSRVRQNQSYFEAVINQINDVLIETRADFSAQIHYGKRWFINSLSNLKYLDNNDTILPPCRKAIITAAGPSLEKALPRIKQLKDDYCLIATDTTLPVLLKYGIEPDIAISIDCQHITYHHFIKRLPFNIPLVLDLASPRHLTENRDKLLFFSSGHPLSAYVSRHFRQLSELDISGGNVTHAALSLAEKLGADEILLAGADFSYPDGKPYAAGTYIYPYFRTKQNRIKPQEDQLYDFLYHSGQIERIEKENGFIYKTPSMSRYHTSLCQKVSTSQSSIHTLGTTGLPLPVSEGRKKGKSHFLISHGAKKQSLVNFLNEFSRKLEQAATLTSANPETDYLSLEAGEREIWLPLFPLAAHFKFRYPEMNPFEVSRKSGLEWVKRESGIK